MATIIILIHKKMIRVLLILCMAQMFLQDTNEVRQILQDFRAKHFLMRGLIMERIQRIRLLNHSGVELF